MRVLEDRSDRHRELLAAGGALPDAGVRAALDRQAGTASARTRRSEGRPGRRAIGSTLDRSPRPGRSGSGDRRRRGRGLREWYLTHPKSTTAEWVCQVDNSEGNLSDQSTASAARAGASSSWTPRRRPTRRSARRRRSSPSSQKDRAGRVGEVEPDEARNRAGAVPRLGDARSLRGRLRPGHTQSDQRRGQPRMHSRDAQAPEDRQAEAGCVVAHGLGDTRRLSVREPRGSVDGVGARRPELSSPYPRRP